MCMFICYGCALGTCTLAQTLSTVELVSEGVHVLL